MVGYPLWPTETRATMSQKITTQLWLPLAAAAVLGTGAPALRATNGMDMEGYGPVATALGGASSAYDNGTAAMMNNPATLTLMPERARLDVALGVLGPDITVASPTGARASSQARAFFMPAFGYVQRTGSFTYGVGMFGQGGMGCQYDGSSWLGLGAGLENRSEVSVGRVMIPVAWKINDQLSVAATADFIWAGMDLKMAMSGPQFFDLVTPGSQQAGRASGGIVQGFGQVMQQMPAGTSVDYAYFNFANGNPFTGAAKGYGYAAKVGVIYRPVPNLNFGLVYQAESELSDLKTGSATVSFQLDVPGMGKMPQSLAGDIRVHEFEWPATIAGGFAWTPAPRWLVVGDIREIYWSDVMKAFRMRFVASGATANGPFAGQDLNAELYQDWRDQTVYEVGVAYTVTPALTLRAGANYASNPIPDRYLNPLFPATIERHLTGGLSYRLGDRSSVAWSATYGFKVTRTNGYATVISHRQINSQVMYSYRF